MKSIKMFGKSVPLLAIVLACMLTIGASAVLVDYLSNSITADVSVISPMQQEIALDRGDWSTSVTINGARGGDMVTIYTRTTNHANGEVTGTGENIVTCDTGVSAADFKSVIAQTDGDLAYDLIALEFYVETGSGNDATVTFNYGPTPITWAAGQVDVTTIEVTFADAALGTYTFTSRIVPVPPT